MTRVWIGTSGYSYRDWVGPFYPPGTRPAQMLALYSQAFPLVELNFTFYRLPTPTTLARMAEQTPTGFQFVVKLPRSLSHERDPRGIESFRCAAEELRRRDRLLGLLCQFPPSAHDNRRSREWLETLGRELAGLSPAVEFRHRSWANPDVPGWLRDHGLDLVSVDVPDRPGLYPRGLVVSGTRAYVRFHSRNAAAWYGAGEKRYDYSFSREELAEWVFALEEATPRLTEVLFLFNDCFHGQAIDNARQLRGLLGRLEPQLTVVDAFSESRRPVNPSLRNA